MMEIKQLLKEAVKRNASDLHLVFGYPPMLRIYGLLEEIYPKKILSSEEIEQLTFSVLSSEQKELLLANREIDFSYQTEEARFRINAYYQKGSLAASFRLIPAKIKTLEELNLPPICHQFTNLKQGFILITGPTGCGKSTTIASIIEEINKERACHIITIEDPIEYVYSKAKALVSQREMHLDTHSFETALRSVLREDPDVVLIGEMRDYETVGAALTIAETGHLVFSTLHTNSAAQTIDRILDIFPPSRQSLVKMQLAATLEGVISQRLLPAISDGQIPGYEIFLANSAVRSVIREGKTHLIDNIIQTSGDLGMILFEQSLVYLINSGKISLQEAQNFALRPQELGRLMRKKT